MAIIPKPVFPNVPKLPGVPQLRRSPQFPAAPPPIVGIAIVLGRLWQALFSQPAWAIYKQAVTTPQTNDDGVETVTVVAEREPVVVPDSFLEFGYRNEYTMSDYPVQDGGFASYDKVANPFETMVRMAKGGSQQERKKFLDSLDAIVGTLDLYDILTPEKTYLGVNVLRYEFARRGNRNAYFFTEVDLYFREIRTVTATYSNTAVTTQNAQEPSAAPVTNTGTVQGQPTTATPADVGIISEGGGV
jgi:hypothetical protein